MAGAGGFFNPHRSMLGLGNFDVVVMESAVYESPVTLPPTAYVFSCTHKQTIAGTRWGAAGRGGTGESLHLIPNFPHWLSANPKSQAV